MGTGMSGDNQDENEGARCVSRQRWPYQGGGARESRAQWGEADTPDPQAVDAAIGSLRALREQFGTLSVDEILAFRDEGRR